MSDVPVSAPVAPSSAPSTSEPSSAPAQVDSKPDNSPPEASESKAEARRLKLKIDGEEHDYDLDNEDQLRRDLQKARAADKRMKEAAEKEKRWEQYKKDPKAFLRDPELGLNARELAEQIMLEELEAELEDPKDREARQLKERLKKYEEQERLAREEHEAQLNEAKVMEARQRWDNMIGSALENSDLPKTTETVARIARVIRQAKSQGYNPDMSDVIAEVRQSYEAEFSSLYGNASIDKLLKLNPKLIEQIRAHDMQALKAKPTPSQSLPRDEKGRFQPSGEKSDQPKTLNEYDFAKYMESKFKGG